MYDAIIVGARCAGSPTAMVLARKGHRVLLVDKASFPSDTISTHIIWPPGGARLRGWGLLERVMSDGCSPVEGMSIDFGPFVLAGTPPALDGMDTVHCPRRQSLDKILVDAAAEAGAEVRENFTVDELSSDNGRVTGIRGHGRGGGAVTEEARIVIGADGIHSVVANAVHAPVYNEQAPLTCFYYSYWSGIPRDRLQFFIMGDRGMARVTTNDARTILIGVFKRDAFQDLRADIEGNFMRLVDATSIAEVVRSGKREERFSGTADTPNFFRKPYGDGWALVGDAGYNKDPIGGMGISDAFRDAETLAGAIDDGFSGRRPLDETLASYQQRRDEASGPIHGFTLQFAALEPPPPEMQQLLGAVAGNQEQMDRFLGVVAGTVPVPDFFAPENVQKIMAGAGAAGAAGHA